ncbi:uncharacterized protein LOC134195525 [Corticium candelabrum]|uniref:uncharacterized protein LOC134195525 n=1 Tax=Corticium candelabrum TaxID=121492 RepID=UPI002E26059E|nr:uncharacterized protein LOC134195525 [Corticium candelabrum]
MLHWSISSRTSTCSAFCPWKSTRAVDLWQKEGSGSQHTEMSLSLVVCMLLGIVTAASADGHIPPEGSKFTYCRGKALYKLTFEGMWQDNVQDGPLPPEAKFSPFIIASHDAEYTMWRPGLKASEGVKQVAETGNNTYLKHEVEMYKDQGHVYNTLYTGPVYVNETAHAYVYFDTKFHFLSAISMVYPSPDWFIGQSNIDLCVSDTANWIKKGTFNFYIWDAGTDSGKNFTAKDYSTAPAEDITLIMRSDDPYTSFPLPNDHSDPMYKYVPKFATSTIELVNVTDDKPKCQALGKQTYHVQFRGDWTAAKHPNTDLPSNAMFSPLVVAGHNMDYSMWSPGMLVSPGVERVAEQGPPDVLIDELNNANGVFNHQAAGGPTSSDGEVDLYVDVDMYHSYVSAVSMIFPSPDWFVGISSVDLCDGYFWKDGPIIVRLLPWDAGTEEGMAFNTTNDATDPQVGVSLITTDTLGAFYNRARQHIPAMGTITLVRKQDPQTDYKNLLQTWKNAFKEHQEEFEKWQNDECPSRG